MFLINVGLPARSLRIVGIFFIIDGSLAGAAGVAGIILALSGHLYPWLIAASFCSGAVIAALGVLLIATSRRTRPSSDGGADASRDGNGDGLPRDSAPTRRGRSMHHQRLGWAFLTLTIVVAGLGWAGLYLWATQNVPVTLCVVGFGSVVPFSVLTKATLGRS